MHTTEVIAVAVGGIAGYIFDALSTLDQVADLRLLESSGYPLKGTFRRLNNSAVSESTTIIGGTIGFILSRYFK